MKTFREGLKATLASDCPCPFHEVSHEEVDDQAISAIQSLVLDLIGPNEQSDWDPDAEFCRQCGFQPTDGADCICSYRNNLRQALREGVKS